MEPRQISPERQSNQPEFVSVGGAAPDIESFVGTERGDVVERRLGRQVEVVAQQANDPAVATVLPSPVLADDSSAPQQAQPSDDTPMIAADEDLIEKEWVDKTKKVLAETKDDPYRREQEVKKLQIDYVKKRYGKVIGAPADSEWGN